MQKISLILIFFILVTKLCLAQTNSVSLNQQTNSLDITDNQQINQDEGYGPDDAEYYNAEGNVDSNSED